MSHTDHAQLPERTNADYSLTVAPGQSLVGEVGGSGNLGLPGDKSLSHRAALFAAMAEGESLIENFAVSGVTSTMLDALNVLGISWRLADTTLKVRGIGLQRERVDRDSTPIAIHCGSSATTMRLLTGAIAAWGIPSLLDGSLSLRSRPMDRIVDPLRQMGVDIQAIDGCAPLFMRRFRMPLRAIRYTLPIASAQVKTCLLLAALSADGPTTLLEPGPSRDHTERMLRVMGVEVIGPQCLDDKHYLTCLTPSVHLDLAPLSITLPGDISAAAFLIVAALITPGSQITLRGVGLNPTRTGLLDALKEMGADILIANEFEQGSEPAGDLLVRHSRLRGIRVGGDLVVRMIDEFPVFAVAAACAEGATIVENAEELRHKESDRISALGMELTKLGVQFTDTGDGFIIQGGRPMTSGVVYPHGDHRLAMSLLVAGLAAQEPVIVREAQIMEQSFPGFDQVLKSLGAIIERGV